MFSIEGVSRIILYSVKISIAIIIIIGHACTNHQDEMQAGKSLSTIARFATLYSYVHSNGSYTVRI